jgi:hypothetical protein
MAPEVKVGSIYLHLLNMWKYQEEIKPKVSPTDTKKENAMDFKVAD